MIYRVPYWCGKFELINIPLSAVITKCRKYFDCILAHTGQNYDYNLNGVFFQDLKLDGPKVYMDAVGGDLEGAP